MNRNMEAVVWALDARGLSLGAWKVLVKMARRVGKRGFDVWPAHRTLAEDSELSVSSVRRAIAELVEGGWINITARIDKAGDRTSNLYTLQVRMKISHPVDEVEIGPDDQDDDASIPEGRSVQSEHTPHVQSEQTVPSNRTDGLFTGERGTTQGEPIQEEESPPTPNGVEPPGEDLFGGALPAIIPPKLEDTVRDSWNAMKLAHPGIASLDILSPARVTKINARASDVVKDQAKKGNPLTPEQVWTTIFDQIPRSAFLTGRSAPGKGYSRPLKLTIDYVLRQSEFFKIWEGGYDDGEQHGPGQSFDAGTGRVFGEAEQAARRAIGRIQPPQRRRA